MDRCWVVVLASGERAQPGYAVLTQAGQVHIKTSCFYFHTLMMSVQIRHQTAALLTQPSCRMSPYLWQLYDLPEMWSPLKMAVIMYVNRFDVTLAFNHPVIIQLARFPELSPSSICRSNLYGHWL
jgi:hypothetical protein